MNAFDRETETEESGAPSLLPFAKTPVPWPYVYRVSWYHSNNGRTWTTRTSEKGAAGWREIFESNREYTLSKTSPPYHQEDTEWHDQIKIERAPVGEWETIYDGS